MTVIDIGALTVDLTTVRIESNDPKLKLTEATIANGGKCGTAAIHCRLMELLAEKFGHAFSDVEKEVVERGSEFYRDCEEHLKLFDGTNLDKKLRVNLELAEPIRHNDYNTRTGTITIWG